MVRRRRRNHEIDEEDEIAVLSRRRRNENHYANFVNISPIEKILQHLCFGCKNNRNLKLYSQ